VRGAARVPACERCRWPDGIIDLANLEAQHLNSLVMWIGGVLAVILAALFAVPLFVDWNGYRGVLEEEASRILGRDVRVGGSVNLRLLPTPYLRFEKLRVADTRENASEPLFRAETFTLWLSVPPLLKGDIEVRRIALDKPVVNLTVDGDGVGNWSTLAIEKARLPFVPQNVALQSVSISDGTLALTHLGAGELARLDEITGDLAAEALAGPFKFSGDAKWKGEVRELRLATAGADADGALRFKATARTRAVAGAAAGPSAQLEGSILDLAGKAHVEGSLAMLLPLPELPAAIASAPPPPAGDKAAPAAPAKPAGPVALDIKGRLGIDARRLDLADIVASIENVGQPQLASGTASLAWGQPPQLDFNVSARWLDFDRLSPASGRASPAETLATVARGLVSVLPEQTTVRGGIGIEQITLGGEAVSALDIAVKRDASGPLLVERFFAELPAGARIALDGRLGELNGRVDLDGRVTLAGPSLERLAKWAAAGHPNGRLAPDGVFTLDAGIAVAGGALKLSNIVAGLAGHALTGSATLPLNGSGPLSVAVEADAIDSAWLWSGGMDRVALMGWLDRLAATPRDGGGAGAAAAAREMSVRLRAGRLRGPDRTLDDVAADVVLRDGVLRFDRLAFRAGDTLLVDVAGTVDAAAAPAGEKTAAPRRSSLDGHVSVANAAAFTSLLELLSIAPSERTQRIAAMMPLSLAGSLTAATRAPSALDIRVDGLVGGARIALGALLDGGLADWQAAPAEITLAAENAPADELMALLSGRVPAAAAAASGASGDPAARRLRTNAALKAVGAPRQGLVTDAVVTGSGVQLSYSGRTILGGDARASLDGTLEVAADRLGDVLSISGLSEAGNGLEQAITGTLGLASESDGTLKLTPSGLTIAGARIDGALRITRGEDGRARLGGDVTVDRATVGGLLAGMVSGAPRPLPASAQLAAAAAEGGGASPWSDQPFAAHAFQRLDGKVGVRVARLALASGLTLADARLSLAFAPGRITATLAEAKALDGRFEGEVTFDRAAAGVRASGRLAAEGIELAALARTMAATAAKGTVSAKLSFSGQALSPRALVTGLEGSGTVTLGAAEIAGLSPEGVQGVVAAAFARQVTTDEAALVPALAAGFAKGGLTLGPRQIDIALGDGALKLQRFTVSTPHGRVESLVTVDLATLDAESEWRITALNQEAGRPDWPRVGVLYTGPLAKLSETQPRIVLGGFERELTVRRMEREVEELERLRKLDEERAKAERERLRAAEAERQRLIEAERQRRLEQRLLQQQQQQQMRQAPAAAAPADAPPGQAPAAAALPAVGGGATAPPAAAAPASVEAWKPSTVTNDSSLPAAAPPPLPAAGGSTPAAPANPAANLQPPRPRPARPPSNPSASDTLLRSLGSPNSN
jgi:uncharacterized protein involved in outer membrane biogenesis